MRYPKDHNQAARRRLLDRIGRYAKKHGFSVSGVASLAASAGVTTGALYRHFEGKSDLFAALISAELTRTVRQYDAVSTGDVAGAQAMLANYLSLDHVRHPELGCSLPGLTPEIARADEAAQAAYRAGLLAVHGTLARLTSRRDDAWALLAQSVGAVMLARAVQDESLQREILAAVRTSSRPLIAKRRKGTSPADEHP